MMKQISLMITSVALTFAMNICAQQSPWDKADAIVQSLDPVTFPDKTYVITDFVQSETEKHCVKKPLKRLLQFVAITVEEKSLFLQVLTI